MWNPAGAYSSRHDFVSETESKGSAGLPRLRGFFGFTAMKRIHHTTPLQPRHLTPDPHDLRFHRAEVSRVVINKKSEGIALSGPGIHITGVIPDPVKCAAFCPDPAFRRRSATDAPQGSRLTRCRKGIIKTLEMLPFGGVVVKRARAVGIRGVRIRPIL